MPSWLSAFNLSNLQFASPAALFAAIALPILILAYLKRQQRKRKVVSSLLLFQSLTPHQTTRRKFSPPLRFFLELLALSLITLAAAAPAFRSSGSHTALLLDTSLSMRALQGGGGNQTSRLQIAVDALKEWIAEQSDEHSFTLFTSSPKLTRLGDEAINQSAVLELLADVEASWSSDTIDTALLELAESGLYDRVVAFSDRPSSDSSYDESYETAAVDEITRIQILQVGESAENFFVSNIRSNKQNAANVEIRADAVFSGISPIPVIAELYAAGSGRAAARPLQTKSLTLEPNRSAELAFDIGNVAARSNAFEVRLRPARSSDTERNALLEDDSAWISEQSGGSLNLLLVTPEASLLGLDRIPGLEFERLSPEAFAASSAADLNRFALIVFHRTSPSFVPTTPTLLILPPSANPLFPAVGSATRPKITSWDSGSSITRYLRIPLIQPTETVLLEVPSWAQSIISVEEGTLVAAGETGGVKLAAAGIELLPFEGKRTPGLSILTLNLINWLTGSSELLGGYLTGSSIRLETGKSWIIRSPSGSIETIDVTGSETTFYSFKEPGSYVLSSIVAGTTRVDQARTQLFPVNAFHAEESTTFSPPLLTVPAVVFRDSVALKPERPIWPWLVGAALLLLCVEFGHHLLPTGSSEQLEAA